MTGIYCIHNKSNNKYYIGSASDLQKRKINHFSMLRNNSHHSIYLQRAWNKSKNKEDFEFIILEECEEKELIDKENYYLNLLCDSKNYINKVNNNFLKLSYNILPYAQKGFSGRHRKETIEKLKLCHPNKRNINVYNNMGEIIDSLPSAKEVERKYNLAQSAILNLCHNKTYVSRKLNLLFSFSNDTYFSRFIENSEKPVTFKIYCQGRKLTNEEKGKRGNPTQIKVNFIKEGNHLFFKSQKECCDFLKLQPCTINRCLKSKKAYKKKLLFEYCNDIV